MLFHILRMEWEFEFCVDVFPKRFLTVIASRSYVSKPLQRGDRGKEECTKFCYIQKVADSLSKLKNFKKSLHCCFLTL